MNKDKIRDYFIQHIGSVVKDDAVISKLDLLSIFNKEGLLDMDLFYKGFTTVISWNKINNVCYDIENGKTSPEINAILTILSWAKTTWEQAFVDGDINKAVISYLLIERLYLSPEKDLNWKLSTEKIKKSLQKTLGSMAGDASVPETAGYSERKYYTDYKIALENNDYKGIMDFVSALSRSWNYGNNFSEFVKVIVKICVSVDYKILTKSIEKYSPVLLKFAFDSLSVKEIGDVLSVYEGNSPLPLILGLIQIVNPHGNNMFNSDVLQDYDFLYRASTIVEKFASRIKVDNIFIYLTSCSNISSNSVLHSIFSVFISRNPQYTDAYIKGIDWTYDKGGENSFNSFIQFCSDDTIFDSTFIKFYEDYFQYLLDKNNYHQNYFCYTTYYQYLIQAVFILSEKSFEKYLIELEKTAMDIKRYIYSWKPNSLSIYVTKWMFWILGSKNFYLNKIKSHDDIRTTYELLSDDRFLSVINCEVNGEKIDFGELIDFFDNPLVKTSIRLPTKDGIIEISWYTKNADEVKLQENQ
ncbi:hypothetical protein FACS1894102_2420 [Spirochaetia bacterium]|nr:hypothetical protein FACS1894102_2420 [Spirochaetia bacterium]